MNQDHTENPDASGSASREAQDVEVLDLNSTKFTLPRKPTKGNSRIPTPQSPPLVNSRCLLRSLPIGQGNTSHHPLHEPFSKVSCYSGSSNRSRVEGASSSHASQRKQGRAGAAASEKGFPCSPPTHPLLPEEWLEFLRAGDKGRGSDKQSEA